MHQLMFNINELYYHFKSIVSIDTKIDLMDYHLSVFLEMFDLKSDDEFLNYIRKYDIKEEKFSKDYFIYNHKIKVFCVKNLSDKLVYNSLKYGNIQYKIMDLINKIRFLVSPFLLLKIILDDNDFPFTRKAILHKVNLFQSDKESLNWLQEYTNVIDSCIEIFDKTHYNILKNKYDPKKVFPKSTRMTYYKFGVILKTPISLKKYLKINLLIYASHLLEKYELNVSIKDAIEKYPDGFADENEKYPYFKFNYENINFYADKIFKTAEEKLEYFLNLIQRYDRMNGAKESIPKEAKKSIPQLKKEIENLKEIYNLKSARNNKNIIPIVVDTKKVTDKIEEISNGLDEITKKKVIITKDKRKILFFNHYLDVAIKLKSIPIQKDLVTKIYNKTYISRLFKNKDYLIEFADFIADKIKDKRYNKETKDLIIECRNNLFKLLTKIRNIEKVKGFIEERKDVSKKKSKDDDEMFDDEEDNKNLRGF